MDELDKMIEDHARLWINEEILDGVGVQSSVLVKLGRLRMAVMYASTAQIFDLTDVVIDHAENSLKTSPVQG